MDPYSNLEDDICFWYRGSRLQTALENEDIGEEGGAFSVTVGAVETATRSLLVGFPWEEDAIFAREPWTRLPFWFYLRRAFHYANS